MATQPHHYYTEEEYLALEQSANYKSEYLDGTIYAMTGASAAHNRLAGNIYRYLGDRFEDRPCQVFMSDMRVRVAATGLNAYPDVVALCGPAGFTDDRQETLLNPSVIVEVLSPSTEGYDRRVKFAHYGRLPSLTDYVLVAQGEMRVEHFIRTADGWHSETLTAPDEVLSLPALDCALPLATIYRNVKVRPVS